MKVERVGRFRIQHVAEVDSTNDIARERAQAGEAEGLVVVAKSQRKGRGRHGRTWYSPPGNFYCSLLLRPPVPLAQAANLSLVIGLALADALNEMDKNLAVHLKWPNDVLVGESKIAGVLLESGMMTGSAQLDWLVAGLGVNLQHSPEGLAYQTTSLREHGLQVTPLDFLPRFLSIVAARLDVWQCSGFAALRQDWLDYAVGIGTNIVVRVADKPVSGRFLGIDDDGTLQIERNDGHQSRLNTGELLLANQA